jgi:TolA-binding protein
MPKEPDNMVLVLLREIRAKQDEHSTRFDDLEARIRNIEKQYDDVSKVVTYSLGQSTEVKFRQTRQESRIDELFQQLEKLLSPKEPV